MAEANDSKKEKEYLFFLDAKRYDTKEQHLTGAQIKQKGGVPADYQLYEEEEGDTPDKAISDSQTVDLAGKIKHFYAVPPATFGA
jgi:hypothetical protein